MRREKHALRVCRTDETVAAEIKIERENDE